MDLTSYDEVELAALEAAGLGGSAGVPAVDLHCSGSDIKDGFFQFAIPELSSWFGIDEEFTAGQLGVSEAFDDLSGQNLPLEPSE
eukprot:5640493-Alexandrium_andersonii.AAC.1